MKEPKNNSFSKNKFIVLTVVCLLSGIGCLAAYVFGKDDLSKLEKLTYVEGQLDYSYSPWIYRYDYWRLNPRKLLRKRSLDLYLEDDLHRYTAGNHLISNLYEEPFQKLVYEYPRPNAILGYVTTADPYVMEVYSIEIDGLQLVDIEGIKSSIKNQKLIQIIASIILLLLSIIFGMKHWSKKRLNN